MVQLAIILTVSQDGATINHTGSQSQHVARAIIQTVEVKMVQL